LADRTKAYWIFIFVGYGLIAVVPLLGLAPSYLIAIIFVILERVGKALRSPSRDAVISIVSKGIGSGKAFGLHELLDQTGAIGGPLLVAALMFYSNNNYSSTFVSFSYRSLLWLQPSSTPIKRWEKRSARSQGNGKRKQEA